MKSLLDRYILKNKKVTPVKSIKEWGIWLENPENRTVSQTRLGNGYFVSTVFLGIDHNFSPHGEPLVFETMVFDHMKRSFDRGNDLDMERYSTWNEAEKGHKEYVKKWKRKNVWRYLITFLFFPK